MVELDLGKPWIHAKTHSEFWKPGMGSSTGRKNSRSDRYLQGRNRMMKLSLYILDGALAFLAGGRPSWGQAISETDLMIRLLAQFQSQNGVLHLREHIAYGSLWEAVLRHPNPDEV